MVLLDFELVDQDESPEDEVAKSYSEQLPIEIDVLILLGVRKSRRTMEALEIFDGGQNGKNQVEAHQRSHKGGVKSVHFTQESKTKKERRQIK